ncbi:hypothetical protein [Helicobacter sp. 23-1046]
MENKIQSTIIAILKNLADEFECEALANPNAETAIYGNNGGLDSLGLVSFITDLEQSLSDELGIEVILADEKTMSMRNSPFKDVATLTQYILTLTDSSTPKA